MDGDASARDRRRATDLARARRLARLLDARFLDPVLGLILPGLGDAAGAMAGLYIVHLARKHDVPSRIQARMLMNLAVDCLGGLIPVVGDLFDFLDRANLRNARLFEEHLALRQDGGRARPTSRLLPLAGLALAAVLTTAVAVAALAARWLQSEARR